MKTFKRPNVLLIYTDQQRYDSLRCLGNSLAITPNLDRIAERGALFQNFFVQNPVCAPSRMSMLTGRYCSSTTVGCNGHSLPDHLTPINHLLKPYGYHTAQIGKLHFNPHAKRCHKDPTPTYGFDTFILSDEPGCYDDAYTKWVESVNPEMLNKVRTSLPPAAFHYKQPEYSNKPRETHKPYVFEGEENYTHSAFVTSEICNFIKKHKNETFFAIAGFYSPHPPIDPPERFLDMYNIKDMPLPKVGENETFRSNLKDITSSGWQEIISYYLALVSHVDNCVGKIINVLEKENLFDNTMVIFTSDHGEYLGDHGRIQKGMPGHDCIIKVPLIISYPEKIKPGKNISQLTEAVDIVPTILDYCGIQTPRFVQGKSLKNLLDGKTTTHKDDILVEFFRPYGIKQTTVRTNSYKYYYSTKGEEILFDLENDPFELENIVDKNTYSKILSDMRKRMAMRLMDAAFKGNEQSAEY